MKTKSALKTITLGCKVNQYETELVREGLLRVGFVDAEENGIADLCIVNTCTVTHEGDSKSRQLIRRMHREQPDARIIVMGCYATRAPEEVRNLPGVVEVITDKREIPDLLGRFGVIDVPTGISGMSGRSRAFIKVQDGCLLRCSYCIIPAVRPQMYSRPLDTILEEAKRLADRGYREIVLTGIHLGHFGVDFNKGKAKSEWVRLSHLVDRLIENDPRYRIRLSSIEATEVTHELLDVMQANPERVCPHLHICLQSGSDRILQQMKRRWGARRFIDRCLLAKERIENLAISTDIIVGFPGETEADFQATLDLCDRVGFSKIHSFPFSARKGTPAADFPDQIDPKIKAERMNRLQEKELELKLNFHRSLIGNRLNVLIEEISSSDGDDLKMPILKGTSCRYAPVVIPFAEVDQESGSKWLRQIVAVDVESASSEQLFARLSH